MTLPVTPAKAGTHEPELVGIRVGVCSRVPAFAGMTGAA